MNESENIPGFDGLLTPKARAALDAIEVFRNEQRAEVLRAKEERKAEQQRAIAESRAVDPCLHGHLPDPPAARTREEIVKRGLERGLTGMLHAMTLLHDPTTLYPYHQVPHMVGVGLD